MTKIGNSNKSKVYDLEKRTLKFAFAVRAFLKQISKSILNTADINQLLKASGSVGANYIEANEALSKKDFIYRIKICRKEAKESRCWLKLISIEGKTLIEEKERLISEATEFIYIFNAILRSCS
jgi:four helix bundle protein